ncbi:allantoinase AllB [Herbiconiux sp. CPCC 203407]|uniref:allantoinase n=1 Tax=Herbiconiux oxytropis TaxID=2970915 RepID=A0AA42BVR1_9MICO|nr:allantoinase AllB [Herbiconiux oxytropis]MCS5722456.1 allantoinase AllB [Herbiconiux oxytropis]MCS5727611.1 allantoinase AllB [Herbiconiux oxytropis]
MSTTYDLAIRADAVLIDGAWRPAVVAVRDGVIAALAEHDEEVPAHAVVTLPEGQVLVPGVVDTHVHVNEPGRTEWEGFTTATRAAAAGGVTTIVDMPLNSIPPTTTLEGLEAKRAAAGPQASVDVGFWGGAVPSNLGALEPLWNAGVFGFKAFLSPSGVDEFPHLSGAELRAALEEIAGFGGLLLVHAEDPDVLDRSAPAADIDTADHADARDYLAFVSTRPDLAEEDAIAHVIAGVRATGARAHILHLSSARALDQIRAAKAEGLPLTVETCPHYLSFSAEHIPAGATQFKCCPPIRDEGNRDLLWEALVDGTIDLIASDHSPSTAELKFAGDGSFQEAWGGISGLQVSFPAVWTAAHERGIGLERVLGWMSEATARLVGLDDRGGIAVGRVADLVAFAPDESFVVQADALEHRNTVSAYDQRTLHGVVHTTWLAGEVVHQLGAGARAGSGAGTAAAPAGRLLERLGSGSSV